MSDPLLSSLEQRYNLPPGILSATRKVESGGHDVTSPAGAQGPFQLMPATARALGVNPHDHDQAAVAAAKTWQDNLRATGGDIDQAAMMYHAGPNRKGWGPQTHAYPGKILAALNAPDSANNAPTDPFEHALAGQSTAPSNDPFEAALSGDTSANAHSAPDQGGNQPGSSPDSNGGNGGNNAVPGGVPQEPGRLPGREGGIQPAGPQAGPQGIADGIRAFPGIGKDFIAGGINGAAAPVETLAAGGGWLAKKAGANPQDVDNRIAVSTEFGKAHALDGLGPLGMIADALLTGADKKSRSYGIGNLAGEIGATIPLSGMKVFDALPEAKGLAAALKKYTNYAVQGGAGGLALSRGEDPYANMALGGIGGPVVGALAEHVAAPLWNKGAQFAKYLGGKIEPLADDAMRWIAPGAVAESSPAVIPLTEEARVGITKMAHDGASIDDIRKTYPMSDTQAKQIAENIANPSEGGLMGFNTTEGTETVDPTPITVEAPSLAKALKAAGARRGIESTPALPASAQEHFDTLVKSGVPEDHALNEAAITYVGGRPTVGTVTRDQVAQQAEREGAKLTTPEGLALSQRADENNAALHNKTQETIQNYGGTPNEGSAAEYAANSMAKASDAAKAKVRAAYADAIAAEGDKKVGIDAASELLGSRPYRLPVTAEGKELVNGIRAHIADMAKDNGGKFTAAEIDELSKQANAAYNPMGGEVNDLIHGVKDALSKSLDQFDSAGPAFKAARSLHRNWAETFDDPKGIANLIKRDAKGNFIKDDSWRTAENIINSKDDKAFMQVVRQLKSQGDAEGLNRFKAQIIQNAYEKAGATGSEDALGNPNFSATKWEKALNSVGMDKLKLLFSPEELAHLATIGRAARAINTAVPKAVNTSNTNSAAMNSSRLAEALAGQKAGKSVNPILGATARGIKIAAHGVASHTFPYVGNMAVEGISGAVGKATGASSEKAAQANVAKAIGEALDPAHARQAANDDAISAEAKSARDALARSLAKRAAPAAAARSKD
jgi:Transglycosylase SLT domain